MKPARRKLRPGFLRLCGSPSTSSFSGMAGILQLMNSQMIDAASMIMETYQMGRQAKGTAAPPAASKMSGAVKNAMTTPIGVHCDHTPMQVPWFLSGNSLGMIFGPMTQMRP